MADHFCLAGTRSRAFSGLGPEWLSTDDSIEYLAYTSGVYGSVQLGPGHLLYRDLAEVHTLTAAERMFTRVWSHQRFITTSGYADLLILPLARCVLFKEVWRRS